MEVVGCNAEYEDPYKRLRDINREAFEGMVEKFENENGKGRHNIEFTRVQFSMAIDHVKYLMKVIEEKDEERKEIETFFQSMAYMISKF